MDRNIKEKILTEIEESINLEYADSTKAMKLKGMNDMLRILMKTGYIDYLEYSALRELITYEKLELQKNH